jgi:hypothetical protein
MSDHEDAYVGAACDVKDHIAGSVRCGADDYTVIKADNSHIFDRVIGRIDLHSQSNCRCPTGR